MLLLDLPTILVIDVIAAWIKPKDLARFDSAVCAKGSRDLLLQLMEAAETVLHEAFDHASSENLSLRLNWYIKRNLKCGMFSFSASLCEVSTGLLADFIATAGGDHVHKLSLSTLAEDIRIIYGLVAAKCRKLRELKLLNCKNLTGLDVVCNDLELV